MPVVNWGGATGTATMDRDDENHITSSMTQNAGTTLTVEDNQTIRFDGAYNYTSATSGTMSAVGTAATRITWQPNGAVTAWSTAQRHYLAFNSAAPNIQYNDFHMVELGDTHSSGNATCSNLRSTNASPSIAARAFQLAPSAGTNTYGPLEVIGEMTTGINVVPSGGTNSLTSFHVSGCPTGISFAPTGGTNTCSDWKVVRCATGLLRGGTQALTVTNVSIIDCDVPISGVAAVTSTTTRMFLNCMGSVADYAITPGAIVETFDECYVAKDGHAIRNTSATVTRVVVSNSVLATPTRIGDFIAVDGLASSGNDIAWLNNGVTFGGVRGGTTDNDYIAGSSAAYAGITPAPAEGMLSDWANASFAINVDTDSGNTLSTSTPAQYGRSVALTSNRTNARATPNKPLTCTTPSAALSGSAGAETATITFTTGIKARSRLLISETSGSATRAAADIVTPWKYHGILDPEMVDFTLPVTSHSHTFKPQAGKTYYMVAECYDPCGRRFLSAEGSFTSTSVVGGGAARSQFAGAGMRVS